MVAGNYTGFQEELAFLFAKSLGFTLKYSFAKFWLCQAEGVVWGVMPELRVHRWCG